jgi:hypothetical protein
MAGLRILLGVGFCYHDINDGHCREIGGLPLSVICNLSAMNDGLVDGSSCLGVLQLISVQCKKL